MKELSDRIVQKHVRSLNYHRFLVYQDGPRGSVMELSQSVTLPITDDELFSVMNQLTELLNSRGMGVRLIHVQAPRTLENL